MLASPGGPWMRNGVSGFCVTSISMHSKNADKAASQQLNDVKYCPLFHKSFRDCRFSVANFVGQSSEDVGRPRNFICSYTTARGASVKENVLQSERRFYRMKKGFYFIPCESHR